ncbi:hypothetical protein PsorP6_015829 [Peronosclerospora sorghi]|uniref:Uncharacterized protein n=1 Tax=Peronosclerospora sorghi TaxID=230839 RepID=A0ACC0WRM8_9STRA|nr:hypothetical protein PsorP6_015829 [Peronosclerospora sorghi]
MKVVVPFVWLMAAACVACGDTSVALSKANEPVKRPTLRQTGSTKRAVDVSKPVDVDDEDRSLAMLTTWAEKKLRVALLRLDLALNMSREVTPSALFYELNVPRDASILCNPLIPVIETYVEHYNQKNGQTETLYTVLERHLDDEKASVESIARAKAERAFRERGEEVERDMVEAWVWHQVDPQDLLRRLKFEHEMARLSDWHLVELETLRMYFRRYNPSEATEFSLLK